MRQLVSALYWGTLACVLGTPVVRWHYRLCRSLALPDAKHPPTPNTPASPHLLHRGEQLCFFNHWFHLLGG